MAAAVQIEATAIRPKPAAKPQQTRFEVGITVPVRTAVVINEEDILTVVAALNNVVWPIRNDDSGHAKHVDTLPLALRKVNK